jgi:glutamyl-tRNA reductase
MSDTPKTDELVALCQSYYAPEFVALARRLERENDALRKALKLSAEDHEDTAFLLETGNRTENVIRSARVKRDTALEACRATTDCSPPQSHEE